MLGVLLVRDANSGRFLKKSSVKLRQHDVQQEGVPSVCGLPLQANEKCFWSLFAMNIYLSRCIRLPFTYGIHAELAPAARTRRNCA